MNDVIVRAPASTANLAAGFDILGCALKLYSTLRFTVSDRLSFSGCDPKWQNTENLAWRAFSRMFEAAGKQAPNVHIDIHSDIPAAGGLGSSAALLSAGVLAANAIGGLGLATEALLAVATELEGHPDNVAPALYGGLIASMQEDGHIYTAQYTPHPLLRFVVLSPDFPLSTQKARSVLPASVSRADAIYNCAHLVMLLRALEIGDESLIAASLRDRLHQPYRFPLIEEYDNVRSVAEHNGCNALCISGAGPALLCLTRDVSFAGRMENDLKAMHHYWRVLDLAVDTDGAKILSSGGN